MNVVVSNWSANVVALAAYAVAAVTHLLGVRDAATDAGRQGRSLPPGQVRRAVAFQAGLLLAVLAVVSPVAFWSYRYIWVRNFQDVILAIAAPALIVLGAPWLPLRRGLGLAVRDRRAAGAPAAPREPGGSDAAGQDWSPGWPARPIVVTVMFCAVWWVWHLPGPFDAAVRGPAVYALEMITYLAAGILMWLQLVESPPLRPQLPPLRRIALVLVLAASGTVLGLIRAYGPGVAYPAYLDSGRSAAAVVSDQQAGGAILWVIPLIPLSILAVGLATRWLSEEESEPSAADFDRLLKHKSAWPSRPGLR
jgi:cytochrome c oxidase assembly factor CtaG